MPNYALYYGAEGRDSMGVYKGINSQTNVKWSLPALGRLRDKCTLDWNSGKGRLEGDLLAKANLVT